MNYQARSALKKGAALAVFLPILSHADMANEQSDVEEVSTITVYGQRVANNDPAGTSASVATALRYDPQVDLQARGHAEGQADIAIRGGLFENTGFKLGAVTVMDPQTGHYAALVPLNPDALSAPVILTGIDNALAGFNAAVATLNYEWQPMHSERRIGVGVGSDSLQYRSVKLAHVFAAAHSDKGIEVDYASSSGEGSRAYGDHDFERFFARAQHRTTNTQTDFAMGYQDNFYGWPGAYTGFANLPETDHTQSHLLLFNQRIGGKQDAPDTAYLEWGGYYRTLENDYDFDRRTTESGAPGAFDHKTRSYAIGLQGKQPRGSWQWHYGLQLSADELLRSTDLTHGTFNSRRYARLSVAPSRRWMIDSANHLTLRLGATFDASNRDDNALLPLLGLTWAHTDTAGVDKISIDYAATSQLPGYTALNSGVNGLFGGNPTLGRARADTLSLAFDRQRAEWHANVTIFSRRDDDLVDWTYLSGAPFARQANAVDIDVVGVELALSRQWQAVTLVAGYNYLDKQADYGVGSVDASFYALNYARHRLTLAVLARPSDRITLRWDNELRDQADNALRTGNHRAYATSMAFEWSPLFADRLTASLIADNLTNSNFEEFPGTPAARRRLSLKLRYLW
ncbi:TonB-dependent receptor plug domain-containing protein [Woeseia oceani]|uniref:TonB-dependent receptor-like beta-barrel domain-containing protein n=1 Tax=Woeseia oceani TaxID=1548547 RepID=A0A193LGA2_9GAMM|nr:hypothetical protein [Woeseia oceani]ANO51542.1 hypothetical protein BA177_10285 [Woeseia oceani]